MTKVIRPHVYHTKNAGTRAGRKGTTPVDNLRKTGWGEDPKAVFDDGYELGAKIAAELTPEESQQVAAYGPYAHAADQQDAQTRNYVAGNLLDTGLTAGSSLIPGSLGRGIGVAANAASGLAQQAPLWRDISDGAKSLYYNNYPGFSANERKIYNQDLDISHQERAQAAQDAAGERTLGYSDKHLEDVVKRGRGDTTLGDAAAEAVNIYGKANQGLPHVGPAVGIEAAFRAPATVGKVYDNVVGDGSNSSVLKPALQAASVVGGYKAATGLDKVLSQAPGSVVPRANTATSTLGKLGQSVANPALDLVNPQAVRVAGGGVRALGTAASKIMPALGTLGRVAGPVTYGLGMANAAMDYNSGELYNTARDKASSAIQNGGPSTTSRVASGAVQTLTGDMSGALSDNIARDAVREARDPNSEVGRNIRTDVADQNVAKSQPQMYNYAKEYYGSWLKPEHFASPQEHANAVEHMAQKATQNWSLQNQRTGLATAAGTPLPATGRPNRLDGYLSQEKELPQVFKSTVSNLGQQMGPANVYNPNTGGLGQAYLTGVNKATQVPGFQMPKFQPPKVDFTKAAPASH